MSHKLIHISHLAFNLEQLNNGILLNVILDQETVNCHIFKMAFVWTYNFSCTTTLNPKPLRASVVGLHVVGLQYIGR